MRGWRRSDGCRRRRQPCQIGAHVCRRCVAILWGFGQQTAQEVHQTLGDVTAEIGRFAQQRGERFPRGRLAERMPSARHLGENHAERKQIGAPIEGDAFHLLWRHVVRCADDGSMGGQLSRPEFVRRLVRRRQIINPLSEAEVHDLHVALLGQHDVGRLQIAVQKPAGMGFLERLGDLSCHPQRIGQRECAVLQPAVQRFARDVLHDEEQRIAIFANFENLADVGMINRRHCHRLAAQTLARVRVSRELARQQLDGDLTIQPRVAGAIDLAHSAGSEGGDNLVATEPRAGRQRGMWQTGGF